MKPVTPVINLNNGAIVVVKRSYTNPKRKLVTLTVDDNSFDGSGTVGVSSGSIVFFDAATAGNSVAGGASFAGADLAKGVKIFAEGASPSASMNDVTITLTLTAGSKPVNPPVNKTMTAVQVTLDICQSRTDATADPALVSDKINVGRLLSVHKGKSTHRAMLIVRQAAPADFTGKLVLQPFSKPGAHPAAGTVDSFATEAAGTGSALGRHTMPNAPIDPANGLRLFAEGTSVSGALIDCGFRLGVDGVDDDGDRVAVTVFSVDKIECNLDVTPCNRGGTPAGDHQTRKSTTDDRTFHSGYTAVVRDAGELALIATVRPAAVTLNWELEQASDDAGAKGLPTDSAGADDKHHTCGSSATGSFNVMAFVDANGSGKRGPENDGLTFNLALVELKVPAGVANNRIITNPALFHAVPTGSDFLVVTTFQPFWPLAPRGAHYGDAVFTQWLIAMKMTVQLLGGGPQQRRGTEKITLGYIQQTPSDSFAATYADGKVTPEKIFANPVPPNPLTHGTPVELTFPVRDTRQNSGSGDGAFIISSSDNDSSNIAAGGLQKIVRFIDSPAVAMNWVHPTTNSKLASIAGSNDFEDFLSAVSSDYNKNFAVLASATWSVTYGTYAVPPPPPPPAHPPAHPHPKWSNAGAAVTPSGTAMTVNSPVVPGATFVSATTSQKVERCPPNYAENVVMDAR